MTLAKRIEVRNCGAHPDFESGEKVSTADVREMTLSERHFFYDKNQCPNCCHDVFLSGPCNDMMVNVLCTNCGMKLNVNGMGLRFGQVLQEPTYYFIPTLHDELYKDSRERRSVLTNIQQGFQGLLTWFTKRN